jgi:hypothetical protein
VLPHGLCLRELRRCVGADHVFKLTCCCESAADLLKFRRLDLNILTTVLRLLTLLQDTSDPPASHLITSRAALLTVQEFPFWSPLR